MVLLDTNVIIYLGNGKLDRKLVRGVTCGYASIVKIEALGYHELTVQESAILSQILNAYESFILTETIVDRAVILRQARTMSLGDAIVAATALEYDLELWTADVGGFKHIDGLKLKLLKPKQ